MRPCRLQQPVPLAVLAVLAALLLTTVSSAAHAQGHASPGGSAASQALDPPAFGERPPLPPDVPPLPVPPPFAEDRGQLQVHIDSPRRDGLDIDASEDGTFEMSGRAVGAGTPTPLRSVHVLVNDEVVHEVAVWDGHPRDWWVVVAPPTTGTHEIQIVVVDERKRYGTASRVVNVTDLPDEVEPGEALASPLVTELTGEPLASLRRVNYPVETMRFDMTEDLPFREGEILVAAVSDATPRGLAVRVLDITAVDDGWTVQVAVARLNEIFRVADLTLAIPGGAPGEMGLLAEQRLCTSTDFDFHQTFEGTQTSVSATLTASETLFELCVDAVLTLDVDGIPWRDYGDVNEFGVDLDASQQLAADLLFTGSATLFERRKPDVDFYTAPVSVFAFAVGPLPVVVTVERLSALQAAGSLEATVSASLDTSAGFSADINYKEESGWAGEGSYDLPDSDAVSNTEVDGTSVSVEAGPVFGSSFIFYGAAGPAVTTPLRMGAKLETADNGLLFRLAFLADLNVRVLPSDWLSAYVPAVPHWNLLKGKEILYEKQIAVDQGVVTGNAIDEQGSPIAGLEVRAHSLDASEPVATTTTDGEGRFELSVQPGDYEIWSRGIVSDGDRVRWYRHPGEDVQVGAGDRVEVSLDAEVGYMSELSGVSINGGGSAVTAAPGESLSLSFDYRFWNEEPCPSCIIYMAVGIEHDAQDVVDLGVPGTYPGDSGQGTVQLTAPGSPGTYTVYARPAPVYTGSDAIDAYERSHPGPRHMPIATIEVDGAV